MPVEQETSLLGTLPARSGLTSTQASHSVSSLPPYPPLEDRWYQLINEFNVHREVGH